MYLHVSRELQLAARDEEPRRAGSAIPRRCCEISFVMCSRICGLSNIVLLPALANRDGAKSGAGEAIQRRFVHGVVKTRPQRRVYRLVTRCHRRRGWRVSWPLWASVDISDTETCIRSPQSNWLRASRWISPSQPRGERCATWWWRCEACQPRWPHSSMQSTSRSTCRSLWNRGVNPPGPCMPSLGVPGHRGIGWGRCAPGAAPNPIELLAHHPL